MPLQATHCFQFASQVGTECRRFVTFIFSLFSRLILEAPYITPNAIQVLKKYCQDEVCTQLIFHHNTRSWQAWYIWGKNLALNIGDCISHESENHISVGSI